ncbi:hypothetical protein BC332_33248 [Capsicum chinense]|nr:hypothetical protein BC332_33248 [Capsicum chinense]
MLTENLSRRAKEAGDHSSMAKRCERSIFRLNLYAIAHNFRGRPGVRACSGMKINRSVTGRLGIILVWQNGANGAFLGRIYVLLPTISGVGPGSGRAMCKKSIGACQGDWGSSKCGMGLGYYFVSTVGESLKELVGVFNEWKLQGFPIQIVFGFNTKFGGEKVVLPLLALGGIALWINYCHRRRQQEVVKVAIQMEMRGSGRPPSLQGHNRLKEVIYCGFDGSEVEMKFVLYILKCTIVLEQVFLSPRVISYFSSVPHPKANLSFSEEKRNSIQQKQHGQAFSSKARVVIQ